MIYNEEYASKIREGKNVPREKWCTYKPRKICLMCETWAEGYRKKNKEQTNLFAME